MLSVIIGGIVAGCRCRCWDTAIILLFLMRGSKIGVPGIEPGSRTFVT